jgi:hypothetical protein
MADQYSGKFRLYKLSDFKKLPAMRWFIKPLVPRYGVTLLFGDAKIGKKTFLGLSMACAIATGTDWCGFATIKGKVLYIGGEGFFGLLGRQAAWEKLHGVKAGDDLRLFRVPVNFFDEPEVNNALMALKIQGFQPDFVVIDTLARSMSGGKENATEDMSKVFELMDFFRAELLRQQVQEVWSDTGVEIIHHTGKEGIDYRGSSVIKGAVDAMIMAKANDLEITLTSKGYKDAADFEAFTVRCESVSVETEEGPEDVLAVKERTDSPLAAKPPTKAQEDLRKMERVLICIGNKATHAQWFEEVHKWTTTTGKDGTVKKGWTERTFDRKLKTLKEQGRVIGGGDQGDCYSVVWTEQANQAREGVQPDEPEDASEDAPKEGAEGATDNCQTTDTSSPLKGDDCGVCGFGADKAQTKHRHAENVCGSRESRTAPDSSVAMTDLASAARQQLKDGK